MTAKEYASLYDSARTKGIPGLLREQKAALKKIYQDASEDVISAILSAELTDKSELTQASLQSIKIQLKQAANRISEEVESAVKESVSKGYGFYSDIDELYISEAVSAIGGSSVITAAGINNIFVAVNETLIGSLVARQYQDGYSLSQRIWSSEFVSMTLPSGLVSNKYIGINGDYQYRILNLIDSGIAQGRDVLQIAEDLKVYLADGKIALVKRYGDLVRGSGEFRRRIPATADWRAVRLVRSELYASLQDAAVIQGKANPAAFDLYDWVLTSGSIHECVCPDLAAASPYTEREIPSYPHPNCMCQVVVRLRSTEEFMSDLSEWVNGGSVEYIDQWYSSYYKNSAAVESSVKKLLTEIDNRPIVLHNH